MEYLLNQLHEAEYFTEMDLISSYHQVHMISVDTWKSNFKTQFGIYEWMVVPFGHTNTPSTFMRFINDIFAICWGILW